MMNHHYTFIGAIGLAILVGFIGTLAAALYTFVIGLAGAPAALLTAAMMERKRRAPNQVPPLGIVITVASQLYVSLVFVAFVVVSIRSLLGTTSGIASWLVWLVAWWVASAPTSFAMRDAARVEVKNVQHWSMALTSPLTKVAFWLFVLLPSSMELGWGWVPHF
jgi:hypothetical protein